MSDSINLLRKQMKTKQISRINSMKPGRVLDAIVAEYIFDLQVERTGDDDESMDYWFKMQSGGRVGEKKEMERVPNYSTVVYSAIQIIAKFKHWTIQSGVDGKGVVASFSNMGKLVPSDSSLNQLVIYASLPEAICKAGLIAVVETNKLIDKLMND